MDVQTEAAGSGIRMSRAGHMAAVFLAHSLDALESAVSAA
jgi:hypothetical protein